MKCFNCNSEIADNNVFCPLCGTNLVQNQNNNNIGSLNAVDAIDNNVNSNVVTSSVETIGEINKDVSTSVNDGVNVISVSDNNQVMSNSTPIQNDVGISVNPSYNVGLKEEENIQVKGKSKTPIIIASVLVVVILAVAGVCSFMFISSPKKIFVNVIDKSSSFLSSVLDSRMYTSDTVGVDFDLKTTNKIVDEDMGPIFNIIKNISLNGKSQIDYKNKKILMNLDSKYSNSDLINAGLYITDEKLYFDLKDLYDKKISVDVDGVNELFKINEYSNDIFTAVDEVKNVLRNSLKDEYFIKENVKMNVNGKETSVDKTILLLNYINLKALLNDVLNDLKVNDKFLNSFINLMKLDDEEITKQDVIDEIDDMLEDINSGTDSGESEIRIILYTKGLSKDFVGFAIENDVPYYNFNFSIINDKENIYTVKINNNYEEQEAVIKVDGDVYTLVLDQDDAKIEFGLNFKTFDYNFKLTSEELIMSGSQVTDKDGRKNINLLYTIEGNEIGIDMSYLTKYNETVIIPTLTPSVEIESLTEEDGKNILTKMLEKQGIQDLFKEIAEVSGYPIEGKVTIDDIFVTKSPLYSTCSSAFGCVCDDYDATCTCQYINENGDVASDTIECENPNYQNCPSGVNCVQTEFNYDYNF